MRYATGSTLPSSNVVFILKVALNAKQMLDSEKRSLKVQQ